MRTAKSIVAAFGTFAAIIYFGWLLYYFLDVSGSVQEAKTNGLGPTLVGLGVLGLLFCLLFIWRIGRIFRPRSSGPGVRGGPGTPTGDGEGGFDADAVVARYLAQRPAGATATGFSAAPSSREGGGAAKPAFGRRSK